MKHGSVRMTLAALVLFLLAPVQAEHQTSIAVYAIKAKGKADASLGPAMTSLLIYNLTKSTRLKVIEEDALKTVLERQGQNMSDLCDSTSCQVEIGKLVQAEKMVVGELIKMGDKFMLTLRVTDVQTGTVDYSVKKDCTCLEDQLDFLAQIAVINLRNHYGENLPEPTSPPPVAAPGQAAPAAATDSPFAGRQNLALTAKVAVSDYITLRGSVKSLTSYKPKYLNDGVILACENWNCPCWVLPMNKTGWAELSFPKPQTISAVRFLPSNKPKEEGSLHWGMLRDYRVTASSNGKEIPFCSGEAAVFDKPIWISCQHAPIVADAVKVYVESLHGNSAGICEIEIFGPE